MNSAESDESDEFIEKNDFLVNEPDGFNLGNNKNKSIFIQNSS